MRAGEDRCDVVVVGEALVDVFHDQVAVGGAPLNVARHLAGFGCSPLLVTRIGDDAHGRRVLDDMARHGMRTSGVQVDPHAPTGTVQVEETGAGSHRFVIARDQAYDRIDPDLARAAIDAHARDAGCLYFGTLIGRTQAGRQLLDALLGAFPSRRFLDLNWRDGQVSVADALASADLADEIKLNEDEFAMLAHAIDPVPGSGRVRPAIGAVDATAARLLARGRAQSLVVT